MKNSPTQHSKPGHTKSESLARNFSPCEILLEQAQVCCHQAREAARLSRLVAARGLLCTTRELLHRAATARPEGAPARANGLSTRAACDCTPSAGSIDEALLVRQRLSLRLSAHNGASDADALLRALEAQTGSAWRWAGDILAVERHAPHRVAVLRGPALEAWRAWRGCASDSTASGGECELSVELFAPIASGSRPSAAQAATAS